MANDAVRASGVSNVVVEGGVLPPRGVCGVAHDGAFRRSRLAETRGSYCWVQTRRRGGDGNRSSETWGGDAASREAV
eukprot:5448810-Pyramimonas_sp.AAC.1